MARKVRRSLPPPLPEVVFSGLTSLRITAAGVALLILLSAAMGAGLTYAVLRPQIAQAKATQSVSGQAALSVANAAFDAKDWPRAVDFYTQAIAAGTDSPDLRTDLGTAYRNLRQPQKALQEYEAARKEDPKHENSLLNMGIVYAYDLHNTQRAVQIWQGYLTQFPNGAHVADVKRLLATLSSPAASQP